MLRKIKLWHVAVVVSLGAVLLFFVGAAIARFGAGPMDNKFGDQHLKTTVALLELHKLRNGTYPATLADLKFTGDWDAIALGNVRYCPNATHTAYFLDVRRGWVGRPHLTYPPAFWTGTGYRAALVSACP